MSNILTTSSYGRFRYDSETHTVGMNLPTHMMRGDTIVTLSYDGDTSFFHIGTSGKDSLLFIPRRNDDGSISIIYNGKSYGYRYGAAPEFDVSFTILLKNKYGNFLINEKSAKANIEIGEVHYDRGSTIEITPIELSLPEGIYEKDRAVAEIDIRPYNRDASELRELPEDSPFKYTISLVDKSKAILSVKKGAVLDYETASLLEVELSLTGTYPATRYFQLKVTNVDEPATLLSDEVMFVDEGIGGIVEVEVEGGRWRDIEIVTTKKVGKIKAKDLDAGSPRVSFLLGEGGDTNLFHIDSKTGKLTYVGTDALDFETKSEYHIKVLLKGSKDGNKDHYESVDIVVKLNNIIETNKPEIVQSSENKIDKIIGKFDFEATSSSIISGNEEEYFSIHKRQLKIEKPLDEGKTYTLTIEDDTGKNRIVNIEVNKTELLNNGPYEVSVSDLSKETAFDVSLGNDKIDTDEALSFADNQKGTGEHGSWHINSNGQFVYTPGIKLVFGNASHLTDKITLDVQDTRQGKASAEVAVKINTPTVLLGDLHAREDASTENPSGQVKSMDGYDVDFHEVGVYGQFTFNDEDNTWSYKVNQDHRAVQSLNSGEILTEGVAAIYTREDNPNTPENEKSTISRTMKIIINGQTDVNTVDGRVDDNGFIRFDPTQENLTITNNQHFSDMTEIFGGSGHDVFIGKDGKNQCFQGGAGNDVIYGGAYHDVLLGGTGNDIIDGRKGSDTLYGGTGDDIFVLGKAGDGRDIVHDFSFGTNSGHSYYHGSTQGGDDKIRVDTANGNEDTISALKAVANIDWKTQNGDTIISRASQEVMVLEDFTETLTIDMFDII